MKYLFTILDDYLQLFLDEDGVNKVDFLYFIHPEKKSWYNHKQRSVKYVIQIAEQTSENTFVIGCSTIKHFRRCGDKSIDLTLSILRTENAEFFCHNNVSHIMKKITIEKNFMPLSTPNSVLQKKIYRFIYPTISHFHFKNSS